MEKLKNTGIRIVEISLRGAILVGIGKLFMMDIGSHFEKIAGQNPHDVIRVALFSALIVTIFPTPWFNRAPKDNKIQEG